MITIKEKIEEKKLLQILLLIIYFCITFILLIYHEPWRDEIQALSLVRSSSSIFELFSKTIYEGHPSLWFLILYQIKDSNNSIFLSQIIHLFITWFGVSILFFTSKIRLLYKSMIIFGYFFIYEYSVIFRNYSIGISLLFLTCYLLSKKNFIGASISTFLLVQSNIYALLIGFSLWCIISISEYKQNNKKLLISIPIVALGIILSILDIIPPNDSGFAVGFQNELNSYLILEKVFIPIPEINISFWGSNILSKYSLLSNFFFIIVLLGSFLSLKKSKVSLYFFIMSSALIILFTEFKFSGSLRHHGNIFVAFIVALWLKDFFVSEDKKGIKETKYEKSFITSILLIQIISGLIAIYYDYQYKFSNAQEIALFLEKENLQDYQIIGYPDYSTSTIAGLMNKEIYYPSSNRSGTYIIWDKKRNNYISSKKLVMRFIDMKKINKKTLLITNYLISDNNKNKLLLLKSFENSIVNDESFYIYDEK